MNKKIYNKLKKILYKFSWNNLIFISVLALLTLNSCSGFIKNSGGSHKIVLFSTQSNVNKKRTENYLYETKNIHGGREERANDVDSERDYINTEDYLKNKTNKNIQKAEQIQEDLMDDISFDIFKEDKTYYAIGKKFFAKNKLINNVLPFDDMKKMGKIGLCRSELKHMSYDMEDDGKLNQSTQIDECLPLNRRHHFTCNKNWQLSEVSFMELKDWYGDNFEDAMDSFLNSCPSISTRGVSSRSISIGNAKEWLELCIIAKKYKQENLSRMFFERYFSPFIVNDLNKKEPTEGLFTGYFLWEIPVSRTKNKEYWFPILSIDEKCTKYKKCYSRSEIYSNLTRFEEQAIAWARSPFDLFNMQVQGSGVGILENGEKMLFGFGGKNDMEFRSYSKIIEDKNKFHKDYCSKYENIFECLSNENDLALEVTKYCDSYVFFKELENQDIIGSQGVPLTQARSIAIDPIYTPYGLPVWIETLLPIKDYKNPSKWLPFNRLWIAQDTGSAIKGANRADLYLGYGTKADYIAKRTKFEGSYFILIPNNMINSISGCKRLK